jgi:hypothetical protein
MGTRAVHSTTLKFTRHSNEAIGQITFIPFGKGLPAFTNRESLPKKQNSPKQITSFKQLHKCLFVRELKSRCMDPKTLLQGWKTRHAAPSSPFADINDKKLSFLN